MTTAVYDAIEDMTEGQLDDLLSAIKEKLEELRGERPEINIGDVVQFKPKYSFSYFARFSILKPLAYCSISRLLVIS